MSQVNTNSIYDASGGSNAVLYGVAAPANSMGFRNRIINGAMVIDQRNAGASVTPENGNYTIDRWQASLTQSSKFSVQQNAGSVTPPAGFSNYLGVTSLSAYSVVSGDIFSVGQAIEGFNFADLGFGTASAQTVILSFWVRSSLTGTFGAALVNDSTATRSYPFTYTVSSANTWEQKTVTIAGDTSGTWGKTNGVGARIRFGLGVGSTYATTAGAWASGNFWSATGATSVVGTNGATFYITGVQLEAGSVASPFERRDYGRELIMCMRYYEVTSFSGNDQVFTYASGPAKFFSQNFAYAVEKRTTPTSAYVFSNSKFVIPGTLAVDGTAVHTVNQSTNTVKGYAIQVNGVATISASSAATYCYEGSFTGTHSAEL